MRMILALVVLACSSARAQQYKVELGPYAVVDVSDTWYDEERRREIPVRYFLPVDAEGALPLVVFSHRLGGRNSDYLYLGDHWASYGYAVVFVQHPGSDLAASRRKSSGKPAAGDRTDHRIVRVLDIEFVMSEAARRDEIKVDQARIGVGGQDAGAVAALITVGARFAISADGQMEKMPNDRVVAALAISPPSGKWGMIDRSWATIDRPVLWMTGTNDYDQIMHSPEKRREGFDGSGGPGQVLVILNEADHDSFSDRELPRSPPRKPGYHDDIVSTTTAFWDAHLLGDADAAQWLASDAAIESSLQGLEMERRDGE